MKRPRSAHLPDMKLLAIDTATEQCSVALRCEGRTLARCMPTARGHSELVLPMVDEVLKEAGVSLSQLDAIAFGRGPGAFTGVRIAIGVAQGLAYAWDVPLMPVSNLAAVAQQAPARARTVLVCMDARMHEVYWGVFVRADDGLMTPLEPERVAAPAHVQPGAATTLDAGLGTGFGAYPQLRQRFAQLAHVDETALPRAEHIALLGERDVAKGLAVSAAAAEPVYLRDQVTHVKQT